MADPAPGPLVVRRVPVADVRPLRLEILRPGQPPPAALYPGDDDQTTVHAAAFEGGCVVGIASLYAEPRAGGPEPAWRLRGMATADKFRGKGVGRALLQFCVEEVAARGGGELWCNARTGAAGFYQRHGFEVVSEPFEIDGIGSHVVMRLAVTGR